MPCSFYARCSLIRHVFCICEPTWKAYLQLQYVRCCVKMGACHIFPKMRFFHHILGLEVSNTAKIIKISSVEPKICRFEVIYN